MGAAQRYQTNSGWGWTIVASMLLVGCASAPGGSSGGASVGAPVNAPHFVVGDRWQYRITDNMRRGATEQLDVDVAAVNGGLATMHFVRTGERGRIEGSDQVDDAGALHAGVLGRETTRTFTPPAQMLPFPLEQGRTWRQSIPTFRPDTGLKDEILIYGDVQGRKQTSTPAGAFDAIFVYRVLQFDDAEFWRSKTTRRDQVWYSAEVKGAVREERLGEYVQRGDQTIAPMRSEATVAELVSFTPGRP